MKRGTRLSKLRIGPLQRGRPARLGPIPRQRRILQTEIHINSYAPAARICVYLMGAIG